MATNTTTRTTERKTRKSTAKAEATKDRRPSKAAGRGSTTKKTAPRKTVVAKRTANRVAKRAPAAKTRTAAKKPAPQRKTAAPKKAAARKASAKAAQGGKAARRAAPKATAAKKTVRRAARADKATVAKKTPPPKKIGEFACGDYVVYPTHGVGRISSIEDRRIAGYNLRLFVVRFDKEKMTLRIPVDKAAEAGLRKLSTRQQIDMAMTTLKGRSRVSRAMWSRRAQEYEAKINSGDPVSIAEVVRDLHRNAGQPDQSYSERQIYEAALERLAREVAAVERIDRDAATMKLEQVLERVA